MELSPHNGRASVPPVSGVGEWTPRVTTKYLEVGAAFLTALGGWWVPAAYHVDHLSMWLWMGGF